MLAAINSARVVTYFCDAVPGPSVRHRTQGLYSLAPVLTPIGYRPDTSYIPPVLPTAAPSTVHVCPYTLFLQSYRPPYANMSSFSNIFETDIETLYIVISMR